MSGSIKKNILFIIPKNDVGGAPKFVKEQIDICYEDGYDCYLATNESGWINETKSDKLKGILFDKQIEKMFSPFFLFTLIKYMRSNKIKLVVCNSANGGLYGRLAAFYLRIGSVYITHGWSSVYNGGRMAFILNFIERVLSYIGTKVLCISNGDIDKAKKYIKVPSSKIAHINNALFPLPHQAHAINSPVKVLTVARFKHPKRVDLLISAFEHIQHAALYVAGDGEQRNEIEQLIKEKNIQNVHLLGEIKDFNQFADFDIFTLISESEGLPMSAIEAMSAGMPLVLSNVGGCPELINQNGCLVENNIESILKGIESCILNFDLYTSNSLLLFDQKFNLHIRKKEFLLLYSECIKK
jgi:glycosyltransferase involved in cell wall biosynthesis